MIAFNLSFLLWYCATGGFCGLMPVDGTCPISTLNFSSCRHRLDWDTGTGHHQANRCRLAVRSAVHD